MWRLGERDGDVVVGANRAAGHDDGHDAGLSDQFAGVVAVEHRRHQAGLQPVELQARVAQAGDLHHGFGPEVKAGAGRKSEEVDATGGDVLAHVASGHPEPGRSQLVEQLGVDEVDLAQVGGSRISGHSGSMLHGDAHVGVTLHTPPGKELQLRDARLAEGVGGAAVHRRHGSDHLGSFLQMETDRYLDALRADAEALALAAERDLTAPVSGCPGWTVARLVSHTGRIHRWAAEMVRTGASERIAREQMPAAPVGDALVPWFRAGAAQLIDVLQSSDPRAAVWTFNSNGTAAFWFRRQAQETSLHRWDAERATTTPTPIPSDLAADGIDELLEIFVPTARPAADGPEGRIHLQAGDIDRSWDLAFDSGEVVASGSASDLLLFLWSRIPPTTLVATGDEHVLGRWQTDIRI